MDDQGRGEEEESGIDSVSHINHKFNQGMCPNQLTMLVTGGGGVGLGGEE